MTLPTDTPLATPAPATAPFDFDLFCNNCRYNLRGLTPDSRCPECGSPIAQVLLQDPLHFASPNLRRELPIRRAHFLPS
ncbi:MAG TPA: hypothetical protein VH253_15450 [Phycisphaerae bacterium]|nr:hypothetical protein [Phycisphaerae bacterium]